MVGYRSFTFFMSFIPDFACVFLGPRVSVYTAGPQQKVSFLTKVKPA